MKLTKLGPNGCAGGACPTIYQSDDGRYFIQGYETDETTRSGIKLPDKENLVEVNADLIKAIKEL